MRHFQFEMLYWFTEIDLPLSEWRIYEWLHEVYWRHKFKVPYKGNGAEKEVK